MTLFSIKKILKYDIQSNTKHSMKSMSMDQHTKFEYSKNPATVLVSKCKFLI